MMLILFMVGGAVYMGMEVVWRGRTHYSMGLAGGLCTALLIGLFAARPMPLWAAFLWGSAVITAVEFLFGVVFNLHLQKDIWDYSDRRFQLYGQICLGYSLLWGVLGVFLWSLTNIALGRFL